MAELIIKLQDREIKRVPILKVITTIGRDDDQDVVIDNPAISRAHAVVEYEGGEFIIRDLESDNGLFANGERVKRWRLADHDHVQLGKFTVVFEPHGGPPVDALISLAPAEPPPSRPRRSPIATTSLSPDEIQRFREQAERERQEAAAPAPPPAAPTEPAVQAVSAGGSGPVMLAVGLIIGVVVGGLAFYFTQR